MERKIKQVTETWKQREGSQHTCVCVCAVCALGCATTLAAQTIHRACLPGEPGEGEELTGDSGIPVIPDEIATRTLARKSGWSGQAEGGNVQRKFSK